MAMTLDQLQDILLQTRLPIMLFTNRLRWEEYRSEEACEQRFQLAEFVTIEADLEDHVQALRGILRIGDAVTQGRYLDDRQRCHWGDDRCEYACTGPDEHCDSFDERPPHQAIVSWLDECRPLRGMVKAWIVEQGELQQKMREGFRRYFPEVQTYPIGEDAEGNRVMVEMTPADHVAYDAEQHRQHESVAPRIDQYEINLERIRVLCQQQGDLAEVSYLIREGMPPQVRRPFTSVS
jgi:hypothetical protein